MQYTAAFALVLKTQAASAAAAAQTMYSGWNVRWGNKESRAPAKLQEPLGCSREYRHHP